MSKPQHNTALDLLEIYLYEGGFPEPSGPTSGKLPPEECQVEGEKLGRGRFYSFYIGFLELRQDFFFAVILAYG